MHSVLQTTRGHNAFTTTDYKMGHCKGTRGIIYYAQIFVEPAGCV